MRKGEGVKMRGFPNNSFSGDRGELLPGTARALELAAGGKVGEAQVALVKALKTERLLLDAPAPTRLENSSYLRLVGEYSGDPREAKSLYEKLKTLGGGCESQSFAHRYSPFGDAIAAYSSLATMREREAAYSRPTFVDASRLALVTLNEAKVIWVDPGETFGNRGEANQAFRRNPIRACETIMLGRPALTALASGDDWLAPWDDPEIPGLLQRGAAHTGCDIVAAAAYPAGGLQLRLTVPADPAEARTALARFNRALSRDEKLVARVAYFSLTPLKSR